jgi:hypothetical protein
MDAASKSSLPAVLDPFSASVIAQLHEQIARKNQALHAAEEIMQQLREALRLKRIKEFGKQSEKLSDLQLELLAGEPCVSREEVAGEVNRSPLPDASASAQPDNTPVAKASSARQKHPGRNELPSHLERVKRIIACAACGVADSTFADEGLVGVPEEIRRRSGYCLYAEALGEADAVIELLTNWAENSMRPIAMGRRNWLQIGSKEAGPKIAAIFSLIESCRKMNIPIRQYLADVLPGLADRSIQALAELTPAAYEAKLAK